LIRELVVAEDDTEGLPQDEVAQPKEQVVHVCVKDLFGVRKKAYMFEFLLQDHDGDVDYHDGEGYEVHISDNAYHKVFMPHC
jgi:hypothetical protein